jgi:thiol-disulfide isomerase/thioredoxin
MYRVQMSDYGKYIQSQVMAVVKPGCPACEQTKPHLKPLRGMKQVKFQEINADTQPDVVETLQVTAFPEVVYKDRHGKIFKMPWNGIPTAKNITQWIDGIKSNSKSGGTSQLPSSAMKRCTDCGGGVDPSVWGPPLWYVIHMQALMYPSKPTKGDETKMRAFLEGLVDVLPCASCASHYKDEMSRLDGKTFKSRDALFSWTVRFHNSVSDRTKNPQPRKSVAFWKDFYKKQLMQAIKSARNQ